MLGRLGGHRQGEPLGAAEMAGEALLHQRHHRTRGLVGFELGRRRHLDSRGQSLAVLAVIVPAATGRLAVIEQQIVAPPHVAIEELHSQRAPAARPVTEIGGRAKKPRVGQDLDRAPGSVLPAAHVVEHAPFARLGHDDAGGRQVARGTDYLAAEGLRGWRHRRASRSAPTRRFRRAPARNAASRTGSGQSSFYGGAHRCTRAQPRRAAPCRGPGPTRPASAGSR